MHPHIVHSCRDELVKIAVAKWRVAYRAALKAGDKATLARFAEMGVKTPGGSRLLATTRGPVDSYVTIGRTSAGGKIRTPKKGVYRRLDTGEALRSSGVTLPEAKESLRHNAIYGQPEMGRKLPLSADEFAEFDAGIAKRQAAAAKPAPVPTPAPRAAPQAPPPPAAPQAAPAVGAPPQPPPNYAEAIGANKPLPKWVAPTAIGVGAGATGLTAGYGLGKSSADRTHMSKVGFVGFRGFREEAPELVRGAVRKASRAPSPAETIANRIDELAREIGAAKPPPSRVPSPEEVTASRIDELAREIGRPGK